MADRAKVTKKLVINDSNFQEAILHNSKIFAANSAELSRIQTGLERALKAKFTAKARRLKKRSVIDIATDDKDAKYREAATGEGAKLIKSLGGKISKK